MTEDKATFTGVDSIGQYVQVFFDSDMGYYIPYDFGFNRQIYFVKYEGFKGGDIDTDGGKITMSYWIKSPEQNSDCNHSKTHIYRYGVSESIVDCEYSYHICDKCKKATKLDEFIGDTEEGVIIHHDFINNTKTREEVAL